MKRLLAFIVCLASLWPACKLEAGWQYVYYRDGYYTYSDGFTNNGRYYVRTAAPGYYYCGCYYPGAVTWYDAGPITGAAYGGSYGSYDVGTVSYTRNWKTDMVKAMADAKDSELFVAAAQASGLKTNLTVGPVASSSYSAYGYNGNGLTTISQGFASQGSTLYGLAAVPASIPVNVNQILHEYQRGADAQSAASTQIHTQLADLIGQVAAANSDEAKIVAGGNVAIGAIMAAQTRTTTQQWQSGTTQQPTTQPTNPVPDLPSPPAIPKEDQRLNQARTIVNGFAKYQSAHCADCHDGKGKDAPNFSEEVLKTMSHEDRVGLAKRAMLRMTTESPGKPRMPKGHEALSQSDANDIAVYFYGN